MNLNSIPRSELPRQTQKSGQGILQPERELAIDDDDLKTRSESFCSSVISREYKVEDHS